MNTNFKFNQNNLNGSAICLAADPALRALCIAQQKAEFQIGLCAG